LTHQQFAALWQKRQKRWSPDLPRDEADKWLIRVQRWAMFQQTAAGVVKVRHFDGPGEQSVAIKQRGCKSQNRAHQKTPGAICG
jgi:hypothetical protein